MDSSTYLFEQARALELVHYAELGVEFLAVSVPAVYISQGVRTGVYLPLIAEFGTVGAAAAVRHGFHAAFPYVAAATGGLMVAAAHDAWFANTGCQ